VRRSQRDAQNRVGAEPRLVGAAVQLDQRPVQLLLVGGIDPGSVSADDAPLDALTELGYSVVGPFSKPSDALAAVRKGDISGAVLDINLDGVLVYPVADELAARGIPFVFVTGYGTESIDERFDGIPVLQKPIERETLQRIFTNGGAASPTASSLRKGSLHIDTARAATN